MLDELDSIAQQAPKPSTVTHHHVHHQQQHHATPFTLDSQGRTASSATKELDDLMASLSDFKVNVGGASSTDGPSRGSGDYAKPQKSKPSGKDNNFAVFLNFKNLVLNSASSSLRPKSFIRNIQ